MCPVPPSRGRDPWRPTGRRVPIAGRHLTGRVHRSARDGLVGSMGEGVVSETGSDISGLSVPPPAGLDRTQSVEHAPVGVAEGKGPPERLVVRLADHLDTARLPGSIGLVDIGDLEIELDISC